MRDGWSRTTLGDVTGFATGYSFPDRFQGGSTGLPFYKVSDMNRPDNRRRMHTSANYVSRDTLLDMRASSWPKGTVVFPKVGAALLTEKRRILTQESAFDNNVMGLVPKHVILPAFLLHVLETIRFGDVAQRGAIPSVNQTIVASLRILLPPIAEQRRIVDLIAAADEAIEGADMCVKRASLFGSALNDSLFAGANVILLADLCEPGGIQIGPFGSQLHASDYVESGIPTVMPKDIVRGGIDEHIVSKVSEAKAATLSRHRLRRGDILLPRRGDLTKRAYVTERMDGWLCGTGTVRVRTKASVDSSSVFRSLSSTETNTWLSENAVGITMPNLNTSIVERIPVRVPSHVSDLVRVLENIDVVVCHARSLTTCLRVMRSALLDDLLSGDHEIPASYDDLLSA